MRKCKNCSTEFEGDFCPHCGAPYVEQKICKKCGAEVTDRFCSVCGTEYVPDVKYCSECGTAYSGTFCPHCGTLNFDTPKENSQPDTSVQNNQPDISVQNKYNCLTRLPICLFFGLSYLLFIAYFCRYTTWTSNRTSYDICIFDAFDGASIWLIVYFAIYFVASLVLFIVGLVSGAKKLGDYNRYQKFGIVGCLFMAMSAVNGCIVLGTAASGADYVGVGAGPVLVLIFSILCFVPSLICVYQSIRLVKTNPQYAEAERLDKEKYLSKIASRAAAVQSGQQSGTGTYGDKNGTKTAIRILTILEIVFGCLAIFPAIFGGVTLSQMRYRKPSTGVSVCNIIFGNIFGIICAIIVLTSPKEIFETHCPPVTGPERQDFTQPDSEPESPFCDFSDPSDEGAGSVDKDGFDYEGESEKNTSFDKNSSQDALDDVTIPGNDDKR